MPCTVGLIIRLPMHATTPLEVTECCLLDLSRGCVVVPMTVLAISFENHDYCTHMVKSKIPIAHIL